MRWFFLRQSKKYNIYFFFAFCDGGSNIYIIMRRKKNTISEIQFFWLGWGWWLVAPNQLRQEWNIMSFLVELVWRIMPFLVGLVWRYDSLRTLCTMTSELHSLGIDFWLYRWVRVVLLATCLPELEQSYWQRRNNTQQHVNFEK